MNWNCSISASSASAADLPDSMAALKAAPKPYDVFMPHDLQANIVFLCFSGISRPIKILLTKFGTEPTDKAKSTTQVGPYIPP